MAARLGVHEDVHFVGEDPDVARYLRGATALLSTSEFEAFGMAVLEAMACGVPVVATNSGGVREVLNEACGVLLDVGDVEGLADASCRLLADSALARSMGEAGRRRAEEQFGVGKVVSKYEALYKRVCGEQDAESLSV